MAKARGGSGAEGSGDSSDQGALGGDWAGGWGRLEWGGLSAGLIIDAWHDEHGGMNAMENIFRDTALEPPL